MDVDVHSMCLPPEDVRLAYEKSPWEHLRSLQVVWDCKRSVHEASTPDVSSGGPALGLDYTVLCYG